MDISEFNDLITPLLGMKVSLPWRGYGSALFLELGQLQPLSRPRQQHKEGEACIWLEWDWRIESQSQILCGTSESNPAIEKAISLLRNLQIKAISLEGRIPELTIDLSNGYKLRSMSMASGFPRWTIKLPDGTYLSFDKGALLREEGTQEPPELSEEERDTIEHADTTTARWGTPIAEPHGGFCQDCIYFIRIDGNFALLDYGVCTSEESPFDGRAVNVRSGCPAFAGC